MALIDSYNTGDNGGVTCDASNWYGQTFTASQNYDIASAKMKVYALTPGTVTLSLYATSAGKPTGAALATATANSSSFSADPGDFYSFTFGTPQSLTSSTVYALVLEMSGATRCGARRFIGGAYAGGTALYTGNQGSTWTALATQDLMFETYTAGVSYSELSGTIASASVVENADLAVSTYISMSGTIAAASVVESASLGQTAVNVIESVAYTRLVALGNDRFYYEDI